MRARTAMILLGLTTVAVVFPRGVGARGEDPPENDAPCGTTYDYEFLDYDTIQSEPIVLKEHGTEDPGEGWDPYEISDVKTHTGNMDDYAHEHTWFVFWPWHRSCSENFGG